jgi:hypothetical protein
MIVPGACVGRDNARLLRWLNVSAGVSTSTTSLYYGVLPLAVQWSPARMSLERLLAVWGPRRPVDESVGEWAEWCVES